MADEKTIGNASDAPVAEDMTSNVDEAIEALAAQVDNVTNSGNNNTASTDEDMPQEEPKLTKADLEQLIAGQNAKIAQLTDIIGKMVVQYGGALTDSENKPRTELDAKEPELTLEDIKLG